MSQTPQVRLHGKQRLRLVANGRPFGLKSPQPGDQMPAVLLTENTRAEHTEYTPQRDARHEDDILRLVPPLFALLILAFLLYLYLSGG